MTESTKKDDPISISSEEASLIQVHQDTLALLERNLGALRADYLLREQALLSDLKKASDDRQVIVITIGKRHGVTERDWVYDPKLKAFRPPGQ